MLLPGILLAAVGATSLGEPPPPGAAGPDVPKGIAVPPGHKLLFQLDARGVQVYKAVEGKAGKLEWALEAPLAELLDKARKAGYHYDGPSWEAADGSKVVRDPSAEVKSAPAPRPRDDVPWLLIRVKAAEGRAGRLSPVVYVQRLQTAGGKAPAEAPKRAGTKVGVGYTAVYCFYGKAE
jgi:hypothetical protein